MMCADQRALTNKAMEKQQKVQTIVSGQKRTVSFLTEVKQEFKRIEWSTKEELRQQVKIVLIGIFVSGMLIYGIDLVIRSLLGLINFLI